jgi:hypothetical protein
MPWGGRRYVFEKKIKKEDCPEMNKEPNPVGIVKNIL